jgi:hypothetical protein
MRARKRATVAWSGTRVSGDHPVSDVLATVDLDPARGALLGRVGIEQQRDHHRGVVAIDGTKLKANASREANLDDARIAREIVAEAKATDEAEDELYGEARGDELPAELRTREGRRRWLAEAKRALEAEPTDPASGAAEPADEPPSKPRGRAIDQGRRGWHRDARQRLDERRERAARPIPRSRQERLSEAKRRLEEELDAERRANEAYEAYRARGISRDGRRFGGDPPSPYQVPEAPAGKIDTTDPDSRLLKVTGGYVQGYNAQAAVNERQIVLAAEIAVDSPDFGHLEPMVDATVRELERAGVSEKPRVALADAGYWHHEQMDDLAANGIQVLIPPDSGKRKRKDTPRRGWQGGRYQGNAAACWPRGLATRHSAAAGIAVARRLLDESRRSRLVRLTRRRVIGVVPQGSPSRYARRRRPGQCGRIAVCESSGIARTSSRSPRRGRSSPPWLPARGSRSTRCALPATLRQPPSSCLGGSWTTSIGPESGSQSRRRTATGADSQEPGRPPETGQAGAPAAIWSRTCVVTWSNSSTNWS